MEAGPEPTGQKGRQLDEVRGRQDARRSTEAPGHQR